MNTWTRFDSWQLRLWFWCMELLDRAGADESRAYHYCLNEAKPLMAKHARWWMATRQVTVVGRPA